AASSRRYRSDTPGRRGSTRRPSTAGRHTACHRALQTSTLHDRGLPMSTQYDTMAEDYQKSKRLPIFEVIEHTLMTRLGDISGRAVLDLACGEKFNTKKLKQLGAGHTVGVDISEEMIRLARAQEAEQRLGIEYIRSSAQELGKIGEFDLVTAVF